MAAALSLALAGASTQSAVAVSEVHLQPPLQMHGFVYTICYTSGAGYDDPDAFQFFGHDSTVVGRRRVLSLTVARDGQTVADEEEIERVVMAYVAAAHLHRFPTDGALVPGAAPILEEVRSVTKHPAYLGNRLGAAIEGRQVESLMALRGVLTPSREEVDDFSQYFADVRTFAEDGQGIGEAIDSALRLAKWTHNGTVRAAYGKLIQEAASWRRGVESGTDYVVIRGHRIELFNALDVIELVGRLAAVGRISGDRAAWLERFIGVPAPDTPQPGSLDQEQTQAATAAVAEARDSALEAVDVAMEFGVRKAAELPLRAGTPIVFEHAARAMGPELAKHSLGAHVVGAASAIGLGLTLGEVVVGTGEMYSHMRIAERAGELLAPFAERRSGLQDAAHSERIPSLVSGDAALAYRDAYMLETLASTQVLRSYADGVSAMVDSPLRRILNPVSWFKGNDWRQAAAGIRAMAEVQEEVAERMIGHPEILPFMVSTAMRSGAPVGDGEQPGPGPVQLGVPPWVEDALREADLILRRARLELARELARVKRQVDAIVSRSERSPQDVAAAYLDALEHLDTADATAQFAARDRLAMRLLHGAAFGVARGLGLSWSFDDLVYEVVAQTGEAASVRVLGTVDTHWAADPGSLLTSERVDFEIPLVRTGNRWHVRGSDEINAFIEELQRALEQ